MNEYAKNIFFGWEGTQLVFPNDPEHGEWMQRKLIPSLAVYIWDFTSFRLFHTVPRIDELLRSGDIHVNDDHSRSTLFLAAERGIIQLMGFRVFSFSK